MIDGLKVGDVKLGLGFFQFLFVRLVGWIVILEYWLRR